LPGEELALKEGLEFVVRFGPPVLFAWILVDQGGIPLPAVPLLLVIGALVGAGTLSLLVVLATAVAGCLAADLIWYGFGRWRGAPVLASLCRITLAPDTCVRRVEDLFSRYRIGTLVIAKFLPGLNPLAAALAGVVKLRLAPFIVFEAAGALTWSGAWIAVGYLFSGLIDQVAAQVSRMGGASVLVLVALFAGYLARKYLLRQRLIRELRIARITPEQLKQRLEAGADTVIVDLRTPLDVQAAPYVIPGALRINPDELERRHDEIPRGVDIVLYCT
jgi:membrane protein DedA with SNARE-associated domain